MNGNIHGIIRLGENEITQVVSSDLNYVLSVI